MGGLSRGSGGGGRNLAAIKAQQSRTTELKVENGGNRGGSLRAERGRLALGLLAGKLRNKERPLRQDLCCSEVTCIGRRHVCAPKRGTHAVWQHAVHFSVIQGGKGCIILIWRSTNSLADLSTVKCGCSFTAMGRRHKQLQKYPCFHTGVLFAGEIRMSAIVGLLCHARA